MIWLLALQLGMGPQASYDNARRALARMDFHQAVEEIDATLSKDPYFFPALKLKADLALFAHQPNIARSCLVAAVVGNPSSADAHLTLGVFYYTQGSLPLELSPLEEAHTLAPHDPKPLLYLGKSYEAMARTADALSFYQQAEDLSPPDTLERAVVLTAYGRLLASLGKYKISVDKEQQAIRIDRTSRSAHYELARSLTLAHALKQAAAQGELALTLPPGSEVADVQIRLLLRDIHLQLKNGPTLRHRGQHSPTLQSPDE